MKIQRSAKGKATLTVLAVNDTANILQGWTCIAQIPFQYQMLLTYSF